MAHKKQQATQSLADLLKVQVRQHSSHDAPINAQQLYQQFLGSGLDYKGASSHGYSVSGLALNANAEFEFGDLVLPGFVTAKVVANLTVSKMNQTFLIIQRQPTKLGTQALFKTNTPISMLRFGGAHLKLQLEQGSEVGLQLPEPLNAILGKSADFAGEELSVALEATVAATASLLQEGEFLLMRADEPRWYTSGQDSALVEEFVSELGPGSKQQIKSEAAAFIQLKAGRRIDKESLPLLQALSELFSRLAPAEQAMALWHQDQIYRVILSDKNLTKNQAYQQVTELAKNNASLNLPKWKRGSLATKDVLEKVGIASVWLDQQPASEANQKIKARLTALKVALNQNKEPPAQQGKPSRSYKQLSDTEEQNTSTLPYRGRSFLRLWGYAGAAQSAAEAKLAAGGKAFANEISLSAGIGAEAQGRAASTRYRFQTCTKNQFSQELLITTQDTIISYVQAEAEVIAQATRTYGGEDAKKFANKRAAYNAMFWRSAVAYWLDPNELKKSVVCQPGSGLCYGMSASIVRLRKLAANPAMATSSLFKTLSWRLRVPAAQLEDFLKQAWFLKDDFDFPTGAILLESAWAAPPAYEVGLTRTAVGQSKLPELSKEFRRNLEQAARLDQPLGHERPNPNVVLQSITARYRMADQVDSSRELFRLGYTFVVGAALGLTRVEQAGTYSVIDIDTWWIDKALAAQPPAAAYEAAVPRVTLFHQ